ncbi:MAG: GtrA family protein, partial [Planctomycetota bacterium]
LGVTWAVTVGLTEGAGLDERASYPIALVLASTLNFFACRHLIFEATDDGLGAQALRFASSIIGFRIAEFAVYAGVVSAGADYQVTLVAIAAVSFILKFLVAKFLVFRAAGAR